MEKSVYVRDMFASIAPRYDATNRLLTGGVDERWRRRAVRELAARRGGRVVDLCCGTGDVASRFARCGAKVVGLDFSDRMLAVARQRNTAEPGQV